MTDIIAALDVGTLQEAESLLERLKGTLSTYKVGLRLFTAHGKKAVELVHRYGGKVFLDLKLLDIPQTVAHAVAEAQKLGVHALSLHLWGGAEMVRAAAAVYPRPQLWGVTVLTSLSSDDLRWIQPGARVRPMVLRLAKMGLANKIDGIICSGEEVPLLQKALGAKTCFVTPGIRPAGGEADDQKRFVTPAQAARLGIRHAVIGRPITKAADPLAAAQEMLAEMRNALASSVERPRRAPRQRSPA